MDSLADPFAGRRDVASSAQTVFALGCSAAIYAGPRACFAHLEHWREEPCTPTPDAGCVFVDLNPPPPNPASEYWLECGEQASPCGQSVRCECAPVRD